MIDRRFTKGQIVLADIGDAVMRSVQIQQDWPGGGPDAGMLLATELGGDGTTLRLPAAAITAPCLQRHGCIDADHRCVHCREHRADAHQPGCPHDLDECDAHPDNDADFRTFEVHVQVRAMDGLAVGAGVLEVLARNGFTLHQPTAAVWAINQHCSPDFIGVATAGRPRHAARGPVNL